MHDWIGGDSGKKDLIDRFMDWYERDLANKHMFWCVWGVCAIIGSVYVFSPQIKALFGVV